jgi:hypothetical protein
MEGNFTKILKQAFYLTKGFRFFWLLGLFLVWPVFFRSVSWLLETVSRMGVMQLDQFGAIVPTPGASTTWTGIVSLIFIILAVIYYFRSKGALIVGASQLRTRKDVNKRVAYEDSEPYTTQLMKVGFGLLAAILILTAVLASPVLYLTSNNYSARAASLGLLALVIYLPLLAFLYYSSVFAPMFMVLHRMSAANALRASYDLVVRKWPWLVIFSVLLLGIEIFAVIVGIALAALAMLPFVLLLNVLYDMGGSATATILQTLAGIAGFVVFFISQGMVAAFQRIAWVIAFFEISRPVKAEEAAAAESVPEVIS